MNKRKLEYIVRIIIIRFMEFFGTGVIASAISVLFCDSGIFPNKPMILASMIICFILYVIVSAYLAMECRYQLNNQVLYYAISVPTYVFFAILSAAMFFILPHTGYCWTFGITMFLTHFKIPFLISFLAFHIIVFATVLISPLFTERLYGKPRYRH